MPDYSIVIPVYNEEESLAPLLGEIQQSMDSLEGSYEVVFVNDCSSDRSLNLMEEFQRKNPKGIKIVNLKERSGQTFALRKGLDSSNGGIAIVGAFAKRRAG